MHTIVSLLQHEDNNRGMMIYSDVGDDDCNDDNNDDDDDDDASTITVQHNTAHDTSRHVISFFLRGSYSFVSDNCLGWIRR